ncbi:hypothetical protein BCR39DRAFT_163185 [Naematelia encephala]|uniref:SAC3/GANP/Nin1/mts3/eIF-3 p25 family-domain-containing protein n=1 Tax=Naematelia encephala TaxID=71784 RepID=A0A1Y2B6S2_9TREE|nr:hypothetical protein BCR39DRAFT_163185 [Naematelia encephala]
MSRPAETQRYQPPHLRGQSPRPETSTASSTKIPGNSKVRPIASNGPSKSTNVNGASLPRSRRDWSSPSTFISSSGNVSHGVLQSPAGDIKPMRRAHSGRTELDPMEMMQSVSRSGGDGAEGDALKDWGVQEQYRQWIDQRLDKHYETFSTPRHTSPATDRTDEIESLSSIVLLFRKLREGVVASHRIDAFAIEVFESSARISVLAGNKTQLVASLSGLIPGLYTAVSPPLSPDQPSSLDRALASLRISDARQELTSIYLLYRLVTDSPRAMHELLISLTLPSPPLLFRPFSSVETAAVRPSSHPFIHPSQLAYPLAAARALSEHSFDPVAYFRLLEDHSAGAYERIVLRWATDGVRERAWTRLKRTYLDVGVGWVGKCLGFTADEGKSEEDLHLKKWVQEHGAKSNAGRIKMR